MAVNRKWPTLFIPHGGGPCFFMDPMPGLPPDPWDRMAAYLARYRPIASRAARRHPRRLGSLGSAAADRERGGEAGTALRLLRVFPSIRYQLAYPVAGSPALAARVRCAARRGGFPISGRAEARPRSRRVRPAQGDMPGG